MLNEVGIDRVYLACGATDLRNYGKTVIMGIEHVLFQQHCSIFHDRHGTGFITFAAKVDYCRFIQPGMLS